MCGPSSVRPISRDRLTWREGVTLGRDRFHQYVRSEALRVMWQNPFLRIRPSRALRGANQPRVSQMGNR